MARIRKVEIQHFRGIKQLEWYPTPGINCLIGPCDSGKSSILDAIDLCLGARSSVQFTDVDFHKLDVESPINISITLGELDDGLKNLDTYGLYVRGYHRDSGKIEDEPEVGAETVLTVRLRVGSDLEPVWSLVSERADAVGQSRNLGWSDRIRMAPTRIGVMADYHLGWRHGSVLNRVADEKADAAAALAKAAREARAAFGNEAQGQLGETLEIVAGTAKELGIPVGENVRAMLDAHSVSFGRGTISLHDEVGIPLRGLGLGSTRLLVAGLQRKAAAKSTVLLIDELEHGLEPHRIMRLLGFLGAKDDSPPLQVVMTTHSPVAVRELSGDQLFVTRAAQGGHLVLPVGTAHDVQSTIRLYADAFLAVSVIVCEGATEVGLLRGLDQFRAIRGDKALAACGTALVDAGGGEPDRPLKRATAIQSLGYRAAVVRDDDTSATAQVEAAFTTGGGKVISWRAGRTLEDELFLSLGDDGVDKLIEWAVQQHGEHLVNEHIRSTSENAKDLNAVRTEKLIDGFTVQTRRLLGRASRAKKAGWFKSITWMEEVAREIVGPALESADPGFKLLIETAFAWAANAAE